MTLINSIIILLTYVCIYLYLFTTILSYYDKFAYIKYVDYLLLFIGYIMLVNVFLQVFKLNKSKSANDYIYLFYSTIISIVIVAGIAFSYYIVDLYTSVVPFVQTHVLPYTLYIVVAILLIPIIGYGSKILYNRTSKESSLSGQIRSGLPNMLSNISPRTILHEYSTLPGVVKYAILAKFVVILIFIFNKYNINMTSVIFQPKGTYLNKTPLSLSERTTLGTHDEIKRDLHPDKQHTYRYGLSMWMNLNPTTHMNAFADIINYGNNPLIQYNETTNEFRVSMTDENLRTKIVYSTNDIKITGWNHIVINYYGNYFDVFINGDLVGTAKQISPYLVDSPVTIGAHHGVSGTIKEIKYFDYPLAMSSINRIRDVFNIELPSVNI